ncbi:MAG: hypothetical protein U0075_15025 [Thermomicrobiales bacterium]
MQRQDAAAGAQGEVDVLLGQRGVDAELAQLGVGLQAADGRHRLEVALTCRFPGTPGMIGQPRPALLVPAPQDVVDRGARGLQVAGDRLDAPAVQIQRHDRPAAGDGIGAAGSAAADQAAAAPW